MTNTNYPQARIWNRFAEGYSKKPVGDPEAYQVKLDKTAALMTPDMSVLEIGCGTGTTALLHADRVKQIDALDYSSAMIGYARQKAETGQITNVNFHISTLEDWDLSHRPYDMLLAHSILHLLSDLDGSLKLIRQHLKPGGWFISSTVCIRDLSWLLSKLLPLASVTGLIPKVTPLGASDLQNRIIGAGFEITEFWRPSADKDIFITARAT